MASLSNSDFRSDLPEFSDTTQFPESALTYWMNLGLLMLNQSRWGVAGAGGTSARTEYDMGLEMFMAHNITLEAQAQNQVGVGGIPGPAQGPVTSKSAGDVSISYNTEAAIELEAGHWNNTVYGQRFIRMARMYGAGCIQVCDWSAAWTCIGNGGGPAGAWPGPPIGWIPWL